MKRTKKRLTSLLLVLIIIVICTVPAFARYQEIASASCSVSISGSTAYSSATCSTWDTSSKIVMTVYLQQSSNGSTWTTYKNYGSATGYGDLNRSLSTSVDKNYYYRTRFYVSIYDSNGSWIESQSFDSSSKWYS